MKVAVTGGSGVVGRPLLRNLVEAGHDVVALVRSGAAAAQVAEIGAGPIEGDVLEPDGLDRLVTGAGWVFHIAGINEMCSRHPERMDQVNIEGTRNVLEACRKAGVGRMIHTSSAVTIGEHRGLTASEATTHRGGYLSRYERSKHLSERLLLESAGDVEVVVVNPSSVQGPGRATGTGKLILDVLNGRLPFLVDTRVSIVDIEDCARGHLLAAQHGATGERYLLSGANFTIAGVLDLLGEVTGRSVRPRFLPGWAATVAAGAVELGARVTGRRPPVCREMMRVLRAGHVYDGSRAIRELGLTYTPIEVTIRTTVEWFRQEGLLS